MTKQTFKARIGYKKEWPMRPVASEKCVECGAQFSDHKQTWASKDSAQIVYLCPVQIDFGESIYCTHYERLECDGYEGKEMFEDDQESTQ